MCAELFVYVYCNLLMRLSNFHVFCFVGSFVINFAILTFPLSNAKNVHMNVFVLQTCFN